MAFFKGAKHCYQWTVNYSCLRVISIQNVKKVIRGNLADNSHVKMNNQLIKCQW